MVVVSYCRGRPRLVNYIVTNVTVVSDKEGVIFFYRHTCIQSLYSFSVFESTAYLKFAKLQYVSSGFRCRVITGSLMRL